LADTRLTLDTYKHYIGRLAPRDPTQLSAPGTRVAPAATD
jgi:hypothetical protein